MKTQSLYVGLPQRIRSARTRASLKPVELAHMIGVSDSIARRWETGHAKPSLDSLVAFALATDSDLHWLLTGREYRARTGLQAMDNEE